MLSLVTRVMIFAIAARRARPAGRLRRRWSRFGHAAFVGLGAYAVGILASHGIGDALLVAAGGARRAALFALRDRRRVACAPRASTSS